jgi:all-trans-8'-apo-beta-carotenal 15,15'-oxygenase
MSVLYTRQSVDDHAPQLEQLFSLNPPELSNPVEEITGEVPDFLRGTYYLNGPGRLARAGLQYRHWLDGDGMVCALRFERGRVCFTNRFVRSHKFVAEETAGHPIFRTFGTTFEAD